MESDRKNIDQIVTENAWMVGLLTVLKLKMQILNT